MWLPPGYESLNSCKVLYLNDGQNVFGDLDVSVGDDWQVDEIADSLVLNGLIEPVIIVGIDHMGLKDRGNEYLPWEDIYLYPPIPDPNGRLYPEFLTQEVMPFVESYFRIRKGSENTGLGGFSYGALISAYTAFQSKAFGFLLLESPSFYVHDQQLLKELKTNREHGVEKLHVGVGTNELNIANCDESHPDNLMAVEDVNSFLEHFEVVERQRILRTCGIHSYEQAAESLADALVFLFGSVR